MDPVWVMVVLLFYVTPTLIALARRTQLIVLVCLINVFLGWPGSLALAMLLPGDRARRTVPAVVTAPMPGPSPATPVQPAVAASGAPRDVEFLLSPARVAGLSLLAPIVYPLWWFWGFFRFARQEHLPRARSFWWVFVPFYGWAIIGRLFHDLEARLGPNCPSGFNPQVAVALVVAGTMSLFEAFRVPIVTAVITFVMGMALIAVAIYRGQHAVNALLRMRYPGGTGAGMIPAELIAATAGFLLVGTLVLDAAPSVSRFSDSVSNALAGVSPTSPFVSQPIAIPTISPTTVPTVAPTFQPMQVEGTGALSLTSQPGDYIGQGRSMSMTSPPWRFRATYFSPDLISITADSGTRLWTVDLAAPRGTALKAGTYSNAERAAFRSGSAPGIDVNGDSRGCNQVSGSFTVKTVTIGSGGRISAFDATFEQHCEGLAPALRGTIRFDASAAS